MLETINTNPVNRPIEDLLQLAGDQLRALREAAGLTQLQVAQEAGISERSLRNLETGEGSTLEHYFEVLRALNAETELRVLLGHQLPTLSGARSKK